MGEIKVGIIGAGIMGAGHARYITNDVKGARVAALADMDTSRIEALGKEIGGDVEHYGDAEEFFAKANVDTFIIASPDALHVAHIRLAMQRGLPTLCEKPIATNIEDARAIAKEIADFQAAQGKTLFHFGFMRRFDPAYLEVRELIESGDYGKPLFIRTITRNTKTPGITTAGMLTNMVVHEFDILRWLFNSEWKSMHVDFPRTSSLSPEGLQDPMLLTAQMTNGIVMSADIMANSNYGYDVRSEIVCENGAIEIGLHGDVGTKHNRVATATKGGAIEENWIPKFTAAYIGELRAWVEGVASGNGHKDLATVEDALAAAEACEMGTAAL
jgi:myo-inositol 2-dehydrogenase/D-chiro-inositol 1-dehydrogenase